MFYQFCGVFNTTRDHFTHLELCKKYNNIQLLLILIKVLLTFILTSHSYLQLLGLDFTKPFLILALFFSPNSTINGL